MNRHWYFDTKQNKARFTTARFSHWERGFEGWLAVFQSGTGKQRRIPEIYLRPGTLASLPPHAPTYQIGDQVVILETVGRGDSELPFIPMGSIGRVITFGETGMSVDFGDKGQMIGRYSLFTRYLGYRHGFSYGDRVKVFETYPGQGIQSGAIGKVFKRDIYREELYLVEFENQPPAWVYKQQLQRLENKLEKPDYLDRPTFTPHPAWAEFQVGDRVLTHAPTEPTTFCPGSMFFDWGKEGRILWIGLSDAEIDTAGSTVLIDRSAPPPFTKINP